MLYLGLLIACGHLAGATVVDVRHDNEGAPHELTWLVLDRPHPLFPDEGIAVGADDYRLVASRDLVEYSDLHGDHAIDLVEGPAVMPDAARPAEVAPRTGEDRRAVAVEARTRACA